MTTLAPLLQEDGQPIAPDSAPVRVRVCNACWALHADATGVASTAAAAGGPTETREVHGSLFADRMRRNGYATLAHLATAVSLARAATFEVAQGAGVASTKAPSPSPSPSKPRASTHAHATRLDPAKSLTAPRLGTLSAQLGEPSTAPQVASLDAELVSQIRDADSTRAMSTATDVLSEHDDRPEAKPLLAADSAQTRAPLVAMLGDRDAADAGARGGSEGGGGGGGGGGEGGGAMVRASVPNLAGVPNLGSDADFDHLEGVADQSQLGDLAGDPTSKFPKHRRSPSVPSAAERTTERDTDASDGKPSAPGGGKKERGVILAAPLVPPPVVQPDPQGDAPSVVDEHRARLGAWRDMRLRHAIWSQLSLSPELPTQWQGTLEVLATRAADSLRPVRWALMTIDCP